LANEYGWSESRYTKSYKVLMVYLVQMRDKTKKRLESAARVDKKRLRLVVLASYYGQKIVEYKKELALILIAELILFIGIIFSAPWQTNAAAIADLPDDGTTRIVAQSLLKQYYSERKVIGAFVDAQTAGGIQVASPQSLQDEVSAITLDLGKLNYPKAHRDLESLKRLTNDDNTKLQAAISARAKKQAADAQAAASALAKPASGYRAPLANYIQIPILIYHYTPSDFEAQLRALKSKGYNAVDMDQVDAALNKQGNLPAKPVVITFDDGYANQMQAYYLLQKYNMKATFYIIDGGLDSKWCIGAGRRYNDPVQPASGCGDAYLSWDQVRMLDTSGLITIGSHTVNHINLAGLSTDQQWFEIEQGKLTLEAELGHSVRHFAYPYGGYNQTTIRLVRQAGFETAVTTLPGIDQSFGSKDTLGRVRSAYILP
jgi:peptidoglycan/xylan/chitin deacetylase (PgdA/CDA1 family)